MKRFPGITLVLLAVLSVSSIRSFAQTSNAVVEVETNWPDALVYLDSVYVGRATQQYFRVIEGAHRLRLVASTVDSWSIKPVFAQFDAIDGDTASVTLNFPYHYQIESVPFDAQVFLERPEKRLLLGLTPVIYESDEPLRGILLVNKEGYIAERYTPGESIWNHHRTVLRQDEIEESVAGGHWNPEKKSTRWLDYVAGGVALVSGIAAIRFKAKADRRFDRYAISGDPELRGGFERYDRLAAVSLGTMQVGLGVLAVRLVID